MRASAMPAASRTRTSRSCSDVLERGDGVLGLVAKRAKPDGGVDADRPVLVLESFDQRRHDLWPRRLFAAAERRTAMSCSAPGATSSR